MSGSDGICRTFAVEDDTLYNVEAQDVRALLDENKALAALGGGQTFGDARWRKIGSIPLVIAQKWSQECGAPIGSPVFALYARKKLLDPDFAGFRVHPQ